MKNRRDFLKITGGVALFSVFSTGMAQAKKVKNVGVNLYSLREPMSLDPIGTLTELAKIGYKVIESAPSAKGNYYGLRPKEIKQIMQDLGLILASGHAIINADWQKSIDDAAETGQTYLLAPMLPSKGQTIDNYLKVAERFNKLGEACKKSGVTFGFHNGVTEFEKEKEKVLYDVLLENTDPALVKMELDLGWAIVAGAKPEDYFEKYSGRFPLWHIKDIKKDKDESIEFGKGKIDFVSILKNQQKSAMQYMFVEQEHLTQPALETMRVNLQYLENLRY
jgi:sugar phosphate isomerase/epimerase